MRALVLALLVSGCAAKDPCAGQSGVCIPVLVEGTVRGLDQLRVTVDDPAVKSVLTPTTPSSFTLPVKLAIVLPAGTKGTVHASLEGLSVGRVIAGAAAKAIVLPPTGTVTFTLLAGAPADMGGPLDLSAPMVDLAPIVNGQAQLMPPSTSYPSTVRGTTSPTTVTFTLTNVGTTPLTPGAAVLSGAQSGSYTITTSDCGSTPLPATMACNTTIAFSPVVSGTDNATLTIAGLSASLSGTATPAWTTESLGAANSTVALISVGATSPTNVWAAGYAGSTNLPNIIFHSGGSGNWTSLATGLPAADEPDGGRLDTVVAVESPTSDGEAELLQDNGLYEFSAGQWRPVQLPGMWSFSAIDRGSPTNPALLIGEYDSFLVAALVVGSSNTPTTMQLDGMYYDGGTHSVAAKNLAYAAAGSVLWVTAQGQFLYSCPLGGACSNMNAAADPTIAGNSYGAIWAASGTELWVQNSHTAMLQHYKSSAVGVKGTFSNETLPGPGNILAITGRADSTGKPIELYAYLANAGSGSLIYSTGNGTWTTVAGVPAVGAVDSALEELSDGEVYLTGHGVVGHYY